MHDLLLYFIMFSLEYDTIDAGEETIEGCMKLISFRMNVGI